MTDIALAWNGRPVAFRRAGPIQATEVLEVLDDAAWWLRRRGISQWPDQFESSWVEGAIGRGETWLVAIGDTVAGTVTLDRADPVWTDIGGSAGYLHRMAVRRWAPGLGSAILDGARDTCAGTAGTPCGWTAWRPTTGCAPTTRRPGSRTAVTWRSAARRDSGWAGPTTLVSRYEQRLGDGAVPPAS